MQHERFFWSLPGPSAFLDALEADLGDGRSVILELPDHATPGLHEALGERLEYSDERRFWTLDLGDCGNSGCQTPAQLLHEQFASLDDHRECSADTVARASGLAETALWITGLDEQRWRLWREFIDDYKDACRAREGDERLVFVVPLVGDLNAQSMDTEVTLSVRRWRGVVRRIDMLLYASRLVGQIVDDDSVYHDLAVAVTIEVAGSDPLVAERLADGRIERLLKPRGTVREIAAERGWSPARIESSIAEGEHVAWRRGMLNYRGSRRFRHSAAELIPKREHIVVRRIWRGQVAVLFPFLEECRQQFIQSNRRHLRSPATGADGEASAGIQSLELSGLYHQLKGRLPRRQHLPIERCRWIRNELAHLRPIPFTVLQEPVIVQLMNQAMSCVS